MKSLEAADRLGFAGEWRKARPGCGCGRPTCGGCSLTPRTVYVLQAELAWFVDMAAEDIAAIRAGRRVIGETVFAGLPPVALDWAADASGWLPRFALAASRYEARFNAPGPIDPASLAESVALHMALDAARCDADPDEGLPPGVAAALPVLPGDYVWSRVARQIRFGPGARLLHDIDATAVIGRGHHLHPARWFEPYSA